MVVPTNGIIRFSEALIGDHKNNTLDEHQRKMVRMINNCGKLIQCHTQDLLDNKLIQGGKIVPSLV